MILTEILVVMCTLASASCSNYVDVAPGVLSPAACERAIQRVVREHAGSGTELHREQSSCSPMPVNTQEDQDS